MRKKIIIKSALLIISVIFITACSSSELDLIGREIVEISGDVAPVENVEELMYFTDYVIRGEVLDSRVEWRNHTVTREHWVQFYLAEGWTEEEIEEHLYGIDWDEESQDSSELVTIYRIYVLEIFQGNGRTIGDIIEVSRLGGEVEEALWAVEYTTELPVGSELVLFLWDRSWSGWGEFSLAHTFHAAFYIPNSIENVEIIVLDENIEKLELELESVNEWFDGIPLTLEDLVEIAEENGLIESD